MWKNKLSTNKENYRQKVLWVTMALALLLGISVPMETVHAEGTDNLNGLATIYHVYLDSEHVGAVDDKEVVSDYVDQVISEKQADDDKHSYALQQAITYIPERVFTSNTDNTPVLERMEEEIIVNIEAIQLQIGEKSLGYFSDQEQAEQALHEYKTKYVDEDTLTSLEDQNDSDQTLTTGQSIILDVMLSEEVTYKEAIVTEKDLLSAEEGIKLLEKGTLEDQIHKVVAGDVLLSIAEKYNLTVKTVLDLNTSLTEDALLQIDQEINVTDYAPFVDVIVKEEELVEETISYQREVQQSDELYRGESTVKQTGQDGKKEVHYEIEKVNGKVVSKEILEEDVTKEVRNHIIIEGTKVIPSRGTGDFAWPAVGGYISSHYGPRWGSHHNGIDIARPSDRSILASDNGTVESAGWQNGYGNTIVINHNNGYKTLYAHLASIDVAVGQTVPTGTTIGIMGTTGTSTGIHLHFEVFKNGSRMDPMNVLQ